MPWRCFSALHGVINVVNILNVLIQDIEMHNACTCADRAATCTCGGLTVRPLVDIMSVVLPSLDVPGKPATEYSVKALNGNDSIKFLNHFPGIVCQLLGISHKEALAEATEQESTEQTTALDTLWQAITTERSTDEARARACVCVCLFFLSCDLCDLCDAQAMNKVLCAAEATDRAMRAKHCDVFQPDSDPITNETVAESVARECRKDTGEDDVVGGPGCPRQARHMAAAKPAAMAEAAKPAAHHRRAARRAAARLLLRVHRHLSNAIACMLATSVGECTEKCPAGKDPADHLIDVYEREVRLFCEALGEWAPENTGMVLSQSGARLYNWPLHCMSEVREAPPPRA